MTDYQAMSEGPEMDVLVAERIFGFRWDQGTDDASGYDGRRTLWGPKPDPAWDRKHARPWCFDNGPWAAIYNKGSGKPSVWLCDRPHLPQFSAQIEYAWLVVEELDLFVGRKGQEWIAGISIYSFTSVGDEDGSGPTAELAICRAGLRVVEEKIKRGGYPRPKDWSPKGTLP